VKFRFIEAEKACYPVTALCSYLQVSRAGYYSWSKRSPSKHQQEDLLLSAHVLATFEAAKRRYGRPRVCEELRAEGLKVSQRRVGRLMREQHLVARPKRRFVITTMSEHDGPIAANELGRDFTASATNEKWVSDITYLPADGGFIFLAAVTDLYSRRVVGYDVSSSLETDLAVRALDMALATREIHGMLIHHSDRGIQYAATDYILRLEQRGIVRSMSRKGNCWDNAPAESFFSTLKFELKEVLNGKTSARDVRRAVLDYIAWYNLKRRHSSIGYVSPAEFEQATRMGRAA
jgi:transposase InsO family protein